ncbi:MAG: xanthine dehydrogenase family protein molybdopterin-binding subunit [Gemmatimonadota bacterium]|nr:xanthine dehydrogenase family protein molybdopterin-binding subunit [Gemmatimonadota bacterium]
MTDSPSDAATDYAPSRVIADPDLRYEVIGTRPVRHDGVDKVVGRAVYGNDVRLPGLLHGAVLRSPHAHARIVSIDASAAEALPGVKAVATSADLPDLTDCWTNLGEVAINLAHLGANCLARRKALYRGHAVAAVAATSAHVAREALSAIRVEYEVLPAVTDVLEAMEDDAPLLHDDVFTDSMGSSSEHPSNVSRHLVFEQGDPERAFAECDLVIDRDFRTASVHQGYIELPVATAQWSADGRLTVWASTQGSFTTRQQIAGVLRIPISDVRVIPCEIGGGFGGKITLYLEPVAAILSRKTGRPVKIQMTRAGVFQGTGPTPGSVVRVGLGVKDGRLHAGRAWLAYDAGAFPGGMIGAGCACVFSCYDIPNARVVGYDVCANKPKTQAYRAPGATQAAFATETVIDELAAALGVDPIDFRLDNAAVEGTTRVDGTVYPRIGFVETLRAARRHEHYTAPLDGPSAGRGVAAGFWFNIGLKSSANVHCNPDGTVMLVIGSTDIGGSRTSIAMQLAETLGISAESVHPQVTDTDSVGYTDVTGGSRVTFATGLAAHEAGLDLIAQMRDRAAFIWGCETHDVTFDAGVFGGPDGRSLTFAGLAAELPGSGGLLTARATVDAVGPTNGFGVHIADVDVDRETGKVSVTRYTTVQDAGKAIHPSYVEGQMQGGAVQGIGWALNEEYVFDERGHMENPTMLDYRMPTALDVPMIDTVIVEVPNPMHPFGVRGVGETPIVPPPAAIANAVHAATGLRLRVLPMSPPRVHEALVQAGADEDAGGR